jgi:hypothetical protein
MFESHLSTRERIELLVQAGVPDEPPDNSAPAWTLLADPNGLQLEMTDAVRETVRRREDRLLRAVAEAHDEQVGAVRGWLRRATWAWRSYFAKDDDGGG